MFNVKMDAIDLINAINATIAVTDGSLPKWFTYLWNSYCEEYHERDYMIFANTLENRKWMLEGDPQMNYKSSDSFVTIYLINGGKESEMFSTNDATDILFKDLKVYEGFINWILDQEDDEEE